MHPFFISPLSPLTPCDRHENPKQGSTVLRFSEVTSEAFSEYIRINSIDEFYITGADATGCVKSTCFNMAKAGFRVHVISDCVTSYDPKKLPEMLRYYADKGCEVRPLGEYQGMN